MIQRNRLLEGLQFVSGRLAPTRDEFRKANGDGGAMLLEGLVSLGLLNQKDDRVAISDTGLRVLNAAKAAQGRAR